MRLLVHGEKLCYVIFVKTVFLYFFEDHQKVLIDCFKLLVSKKVLIGFVFLTRLVKKSQTLSNGMKLIPVRLELRTFCLLG